MFWITIGIGFLLVWATIGSIIMCTTGESPKWDAMTNKQFLLVMVALGPSSWAVCACHALLYWYRRLKGR